MIGGGGGMAGTALFFTKRDRTTGSGGFEYAAGSITSVLAYKMLKVLDWPCFVELTNFPALGREMGISPR
jgi:hypothetical protein